MNTKIASMSTFTQTKGFPGAIKKALSVTHTHINTHTHRIHSLNESTHAKSGTQGQESARGLATVIKYNGWLLEPCQAEAWSKTMAGLWTERLSREDRAT